MQRRYKGTEIPTFDEILAEREKIAEQYPNYELPNNLQTEVQGINVVICSLEEARNIRENDGINGINKKINDVITDFIDNVLDTALATVDSVREMEKDVNADPAKKFKVVNSEQATNSGAREVEVDINDDGSYEYTSNEEVTGVEINEEEVIDSEDNEFVEESVVEEEQVETSNILTDEEVDLIVSKAEEAAANNPDIQKLREIKENPPEKEEGEMKPLMVNVDPNTGENQLVGAVDEDYLDDDETFEEMVERIENSDIDFNSSNPITKEEAIDFLSNKDNTLLIQDMIKDEEMDIDPETIQQLLNVANRRIAKEEFHVYRDLPQKIKDMIDSYATQVGISPLDNRGRTFKNQIADALLDDFIANINMDRIKHDFNVELENIFTKAAEDIGENVVGYSQEKIKKYREATEKMTDFEKKEKLTNILNSIQEAYDLNNFKEFASHCRIKKFDLEKPSRYYEDFLRKYKDSPYNIYNINMARPILFRNLNSIIDGEEFTDKDVNGFFVAFCKQTQSMNPENPIEHAYMYYVIYNIVLADINKSETTREVSVEFMKNVRDVIVNLRNRNSNVF